MLFSTSLVTLYRTAYKKKEADGHFKHYMQCVSDEKNLSTCFYSDYVKLYDGNGTEVFASHGWNSTSSNKSLQQVSFGESKNITIQVSLVDPWSYVKIDYGMSKESLTLGRENKYVVVYAFFALLVKSGIRFMAMVSYIFIWRI